MKRPPEASTESVSLARVLAGSLNESGKSDEETTAMLRSRLADLKSGKDAGLSFEEVFGERET
ncbi:MAG: hypothetical protein RLZZ15_4283 [Verrucomicrobiota bacterium]|jgi:hypothetical protein